MHTSFRTAFHKEKMLRLAQTNTREHILTACWSGRMPEKISNWNGNNKPVSIFISHILIGFISSPSVQFMDIFVRNDFQVANDSQSLTKVSSWITQSPNIKWNNRKLVYNQSSPKSMAMTHTLHKSTKQNKTIHFFSFRKYFIWWVHWCLSEVTSIFKHWKWYIYRQHDWECGIRNELYADVGAA